MRRITIVVLIFLWLFCFGMMGLVFIMNAVETLSEENTTEFTATVKSVEMKGEGTHEYGIVYSEEYGDKLSTYSIRGIIDISDLKNIKASQIVFFRVQNIWIGQWEEMSFIPIVSLRTEEKELASFRQYNEHTASSLLLATITASVISLILFLVAMHCTLRLKGINVFRRNKK